MHTKLILASSSKYRADLLARLGVPFASVAPELDESPQPGETPAKLAQRLALAKAQAIATGHPGCWALGSDQVASTGFRIIGKPGTRTRAVEQLRTFSGKSLTFYTAVALVNGDRTFTGLDTTIARFRTLDAAEIKRYLDAEPAHDSAGAFKCEGLGISLFSAIETRDPTALVGLPLITVRRLLAQAGFTIP
ncbi:MAG: septum formation protein Maf [Hydrocarboniphaga effusa]|nr:septum formation protein Maf [Hydrocarboniphaga effusa]